MVANYARCHTSHPALKLGKAVIYGGACSSPNPKAKIHVALDSYSTPSGPLYYPWNDSGVLQVAFPITDMSVPSDPKQFLQLIAWMADRLNEGTSIHVGCIGGHGRTGTVLAALVKHMTGEEDAITVVRKLYCKKAVESQKQVEFLGKHFGIKPAQPTKQGFFTDFETKYPTYKSGGKGKSKGKVTQHPKSQLKTLPPAQSKKNIWGFKSKKDSASDAVNTLTI